MHRATEESVLTDSADGSIARRAEAVGLDREEAATSALTKCAFSWKFALKEFTEVRYPLAAPKEQEEPFLRSKNGYFPLCLWVLQLRAN